MRISNEEDCPTNEFDPGEPSGSCWGDGHYECANCLLFRADFKADPTKRDKILEGQGCVVISNYPELKSSARWEHAAVVMHKDGSKTIIKHN
jgi:hypothetical protein